MGTQNSDTSPLEALEWAVLSTRANRAELEETLRALPRWRFRRRRAVERSVRRRQMREQALQEVLAESNGEPTNGSGPVSPEEVVRLDPFLRDDR
jgi:hypothetical protein